MGPTFDKIMADYKDDVQMIFRHYPLGFHKHAQLASEAAVEAQAQKKFWEYHDKLFANQHALTRPDLERYAKDIGMNMKAFKKALDTGKHKAAVTADRTMATNLGVDGTPTMLINGRMLVGAQPIDKVRATVENAISQAKRLIADGQVKRKNFYQGLQQLIPKEP